MKTPYTRGVSIIELVVVITILLLLVVIGLSAASNFGKAGSVRTSARTLATTLDEARARTLASENSSQYGVHIEVGESDVTLFRGANYTSSDPDNKVFEFDRRAQISSTTLGTTTDVVFTRLSGTTTPIVVIIGYAGDASTTKSVSVQATGLITVSQ